VRLTRTRWRIEVDLSRRVLRLLHDGRVTRRMRAVVGAPATPTPRGRFAISEIARQPDPTGFLGPFALHLTAHSDVLDDYGGGPGRVAIHGRGRASLDDPLGTARSRGCIRVDDIRELAARVVPGVPVIVSA
jgi:lipoprotein-anchoring transpeptidase ErfK/SrfK